MDEFNRRAFLRLSTGVLCIPPLTIASPANAALAHVLWWIGRRLTGVFATRTIRRRVMGAAAFTGTSAPMVAANDLTNGVIREFGTNVLYDELVRRPESGFSTLHRHYSPQVVASNEDGSLSLEYPQPPAGTAFLTQDSFGYPVSHLSNFDGSFDLAVSGVDRSRSKTVWLKVLDLDQGYEIDAFPQSQYLTPGVMNRGQFNFQLSMLLEPGRKMLLGYDGENGGTLIAGSDIFYVDKIY